MPAALHRSTLLTATMVSKWLTRLTVLRHPRTCQRLAQAARPLFQGAGGLRDRQNSS